MSKKYKRRGKYSEVRPVPTDAEIDAILADIKPEVALEALAADAKAYLNDRYDLARSVGIPEVAVKHVVRKLGGLEDLPNTSRYPRELRESIIDVQDAHYRFGTEYQNDNPITGEKNAIISTDPVTGAALKMFVGDSRTTPRDALDGYDKASEYIQQQIMRRAGMKAVANNNVQDTAPDFKVLMPNGSSIIVDGQTTRPTYDAGKTQAYTWVDPTTMPHNANVKSRVEEVKRILAEEIESNPNSGLEEIVDNAKRLKGPYTHRPFKGKLYETSEDLKKDQIIYTKYSNRDHEENKATDDRLAMPPRSVELDTVKDLQENVNQITGQDLINILNVHPNGYGSGQYKRRPMIDVNIPPAIYNQSRVNLVERFPQIMQFLDY